MKKLTCFLLAALLIGAADAYAIKITKTVLQNALVQVNKVKKVKCYADSCEHVIGIPYVENGNERQVLDVYYAKENRKNAVLIDIHGGFYVAGRRENQRPFASVFLKQGYDVVLLEYRLVDGDSVDVSCQLQDCANAVDFLTTHADELRLNKDRMFIAGGSAGSHLALYIAEGTENKDMPFRPNFFHTLGVLLNCPAYDFASFNDTGLFYPSAMEWFLSPHYTDQQWMTQMSPRTNFRSYTGPLFVSTSRMDFLRSQALMISGDCMMLQRDIDFVHIESQKRKVGHVHNVNAPSLPESQEVNNKMIAFMNRILGL